MKTGGLGRLTVVAAVVVLTVVMTGFGIEREITTNAFDRLEAAQVAQDAQRLAVAIDAQVSLLQMYGSTNSIWDDSYQAVKTGNEADLVAAFPTGQLRSLYHLDGVVGVGPGGARRVGGLVGTGSAYLPLPSDLARAGVLAQLFTASAPAGEGRCGLIVSSVAPLLFCGFAAYNSNGQWPPSGGLIYLKALSAPGLQGLSQQTDMPIALVNGQRPGSQDQPDVASSIGPMRVATKALSASQMALDVAVPTVSGARVVLEVLRPRPIHRMASNTALTTLFMMLGAGALLLGVVMVLMRRGIRAQVRPLRQTAEAVITSGDRSLRIGHTGTGEIAALGTALDRMLDALETKTAELDQEHLRREEQLARESNKQQLAEQALRHRAQLMIDETVTGVLDEMRSVLGQARTVQQASGSIEQRASAALGLTRSVADETAGADRVVAAMAESLSRVDNVAKLIADVAEQTNLLALNATIEAARAGTAGLGFSVVANEVKALAAQTRLSTREITDTISALGADAEAMASALTAVTAGVAHIDAASAEVSSVVSEQRTSVEHLGRAVADTIDRIETMSRLTDKLERRNRRRAATASTASMQCNGRSTTANVLNISDSGMLCTTPAEFAVANGEVVEAVIRLDGQNETVAAQVVWRDGDADCEQYYGMQFQDLNPSANANIRAYVARLLAGGKAS